jgi:hypothetical protein
VGQLVKDRRSDARYAWPPEEISQATLRPGCVVSVVDLSVGGALVQSSRPLRPGARLHFHLVLRQRRFGLIARVLRCAVWTIDSPEGVAYRGALQFEEPCELFWETGTLYESHVPATLGIHHREAGIAYPDDPLGA